MRANRGDRTEGQTNAMATGERLVLARLAAQRAGRAATARVLRSAGLKNWLSPSIADEFHIVPQDLRTPDPSFLVEIAAHQFGLAGAVANLSGTVALRRTATDHGVGARVARFQLAAAPAGRRQRRGRAGSGSGIRPELADLGKPSTIAFEPRSLRDASFPGSVTPTCCWKAAVRGHMP